MKFSYNWLKELYKKTPSPEKAANLLTFHSFTVESIERHGSDFVFDIDSKSLGRRAADAAGHIGLARELAVILGESFPPTNVSVQESAPRASDFLALTIAKNVTAARHSGRLLFEIENKESPKWIEERLIACGLRPINLIVDVTNYVMLEAGQPLHAFDYDKLAKPHNGSKVVIDIRFAKRGETIDILGESRRFTLTPNDLVLADAKGALDVAGIKGGKRSEVSKSTKRIFLSAANFDGPTIRQTSKCLGLRTDASWRFEHGMDPEGTIYALNRAAMLLQKYGGAKPLQGIVDIYPKKERPSGITFSLSRAERLLGIKIPEAFAIGILRRLGCEVKKLKAGTYQITAPSFRRDLRIAEDLIEEVGRLWGYEKIPAEMPLLRGIIPAKSDRQVFEDALKDRLVGFGFTESQLSAFTGERELALYGLSISEHFMLENPMSPETQYLLMIPAIKYLKSAAENLRHKKEVRIFGMPKAFIKTPKGPPAGPASTRLGEAGEPRLAGGPYESRRLIIVLAEEGKDGREEFYTLKGVVDSLLESFGVSDHWYDDANVKKYVSWAHPYRIAEIKVGETLLGIIAEVNADIREKLKTQARLVVAEFLIDRLISEIEKEQEFRPIAKFPAIVRDIALVVPQDIRLQEVENIIFNSAKLLVDVDLFDEYEGSDMPQGMKSIAFHLVFQSEEKTLTDEEVAREFGKALRAVKEKGWEVRG